MIDSSLRRRALAGLAAVALLATPVPATAAPGDPASATVEPALEGQLASEGSTDFWVYLRQEADLSAASGIGDRADQGEFVYDQLTGTAAASQSSLLSMLDAEGVDYQAFWIANAVRVTGDAALLERIAARPDVAEVTADRVYELPDPVAAESPRQVDGVEWGVDRVGAPRVWDEHDARGEGIVVGVIDSGALFTHEALVDQYRGNLGDGAFDHDYHWFDPAGICPAPEPCDNTGHGTHVTGTIAGAGGIGVAPAATWIAAKGCEGETCSQAALMAAGEFMLAPTDRLGQNPDASRRPHIVNNSWGSSRYTDPWYREMVRAWVAAGVFPQFSAGNAGPGCGTASNPGNLPESYAAGAFDVNGDIYARSSRGPSAWDGIAKPNLTAPGVAVRSAWHEGGYRAATGTSMASPHVSGTVALLWSAAPALLREIDATRDLLDVTAVDTDDTSCGGTPERNHVWGEGKLDAYALVREAPDGPVGTVTGTVSDAETGQPVDGAAVTATGEVVRERTTGSGGQYAFTLPAGDYTVATTGFGYRDRDIQVTVTADQTTTVDIPLTPLDRATISGRVTDGSGHGWPLAAEIEVDGTPLATTTDPETGQYRLPVPAGEAYTLRVRPEYPGYAGTSETVEVGEQDLTLDVALVADRCEVAPGYESSANLGVLGDYGNYLAGFLDRAGLRHQPVSWGDDVSEYDAIVVNRPEDPGAEAFGEFLADTDAAGTGVLFLDNFASLSGGRWGDTGITLLSRHTGAPADRTTASLRVPYLYYQVVEEHPILAGFEAGDEIVFDETAGSKVHAWFDGYEGAGRTVIADAGRGGEDALGGGIGVQQRANNRHALLSMHAATLVISPVDDQPQDQDPRQWTEAGAELFVNALEWVSPTDFECQPVEGGLVMGQVTDRNTGEPVPGATVTGAAGPDQPVSSGTDGSYWLFSPATGGVELTAQAHRYPAYTETVEVAASAANRADLALPVGRFEPDRASVAAALRPGQATQRTFTVTNTGTAPAQVELVERRGGAGDTAPTEVPAEVSPAAAALLDAPGGAAATAQPAAQPWTTLPDYPAEIMDNAVATVDGQVYSFGGWDGSIQDRAYTFDPEAERWQPIARMPQPLDKPEAAAIDGLIYVVGGWNGESSPSTATHVYDPAGDTWSRAADLPAGRAAPGAAVLDGQLYVVGGCTDSSCDRSAAVWRYHPDTDAWQALADYPAETAWLACAGLAADHTVVCTSGGGDDGPVATTYAYDPDRDEWTRRADAPYASWGMAYAAANGRLVISSGATESGGAGAVTNQGAIYHPGSDTWTALEPSGAPTFRSGSACGFYKIGGARANLLFDSTVEHHPDFGECDTTDAGWLSIDPPAATVAPGESVTVTVSLTASPEPGTYTAAVGLRDQTPHPAEPVEVTMTVHEPVACDRTVTGRHTGPLTVTSGVTCLAEGATVRGQVTVRSGAGLVADGATITGAVSIDGAAVVSLTGSEVGGPVTVYGSTGEVTIHGNRLRGPVTLLSNATGDWSAVVSGNTIAGGLVCAYNDPPPVDQGDPNTVTGRTSGQCTGF